MSICNIKNIENDGGREQLLTTNTSGIKITEMLMEKRSSECTTTQDKNNFYYWNDKNCHYLKWENNDIINQHYKPEPHARLPPPPAPLQNQSNHSVEPRKQPLYKRILIVDDDIDITLTFKSSIEEYYDDKRFEVYTYNNPLVALSEFKPNFYDLLLTDINMPDMNGFELCQKILELDVDVRVCFISAGEANIEANVSMDALSRNQFQ